MIAVAARAAVLLARDDRGGRGLPADVVPAPAGRLGGTRAWAAPARAGCGAGSRCPDSAARTTEARPAGDRTEPHARRLPCMNSTHAASGTDRREPDAARGTRPYARDRCTPPGAGSPTPPCCSTASTPSSTPCASAPRSRWRSTTRPAPPPSPSPTSWRRTYGTPWTRSLDARYPRAAYCGPRAAPAPHRRWPPWPYAPSRAANLERAGAHAAHRARRRPRQPAQPRQRGGRDPARRRLRRDRRGHHRHARPLAPHGRARRRGPALRDRRGAPGRSTELPPGPLFALDPEGDGHPGR